MSLRVPALREERPHPALRATFSRFAGEGLFVAAFGLEPIFGELESALNIDVRIRRVHDPWRC
jgi:hypothetical protein